MICLLYSVRRDRSAGKSLALAELYDHTWQLVVPHSCMEMDQRSCFRRCKYPPKEHRTCDGPYTGTKHRDTDRTSSSPALVLPGGMPVCTGLGRPA